jgi:hypothetical protein
MIVNCTLVCTVFVTSRSSALKAMKLTLGLVYMYAAFMLFGKHTSDSVCICPDHKTWMHNVTHHEFCGKELSGSIKDCEEDALYNCTKGNPVAVYWELCKKAYSKPSCTPREKSHCKFKNPSVVIECWSQRACVHKPAADRVMMQTYGKTSLLTQNG